MSNIVYTTTETKPGPSVMLANAYAVLVEVIPAGDILGQAISDYVPRGADAGFILCFKLSDAGIETYRDGISGAPKGFREWPAGAPEPDFSEYPIE